MHMTKVTDEKDDEDQVEMVALVGSGRSRHGESEDGTGEECCDDFMKHGFQ